MAMLDQEKTRGDVCVVVLMVGPRPTEAGFAVQTGGYDSSRGDVRRESGRCLPCRVWVWKRQKERKRNERRLGGRMRQETARAAKV